MTVIEALRFEQIIKNRSIESFFRTGGGAIEDCTVYSSNSYYKGGNITITTMHNGDVGFLFIEQVRLGHKFIAGIINLADIKEEIEISSFDSKYDNIRINYGTLGSCYSFYIEKVSPVNNKQIMDLKTCLFSDPLLSIENIFCDSKQIA